MLKGVSGLPLMLMIFILVTGVFVTLILIALRPQLDISPLQSFFKKQNVSSVTDVDSLPLVHIPIEPYRLSSYHQMKEIFMTYDVAACKEKVQWGGFDVYQETYKGKYWTKDGNYTVCMDPKIRPTPNACIVYSIGIKNEWSFDEKAEELGCKVFSYDPSMGQKPHMHSAGIKYMDYGIANVDTENGPNGWKMRRLQTLIKENKHEDSLIDVFKIDVEEAEHESIPQILQSGVLRNVKQITIEIHNKLRLDLPLDQYYSTYWQIVNQGFVKFFSDDWPGGCERKNDKGELEVYCYIFSFYNARFLK